MPTSIYTRLEDAVRNVALVSNKNHTSTPIIFSHQPGAEPTTSYVVINILSVEQQGKAATPALLNRSSKLDIRVMYNTLIQFSFYGDDAGAIAHDFYHLFNSPETLESMSKNSVALLSKTRLRRNPQRRDTRWVESFNFDATFNYIINTPITGVSVASDGITVANTFSG